MEKRGKTALLIAVCAAAFGGGVFAGYVRDTSRDIEESAPPSRESMRLAEALPRDEEESVPLFVTPEKLTDHYEVKTSGDYIIVCEVYTDNTKTEIERAPIETSMLLSEDKRMLERGINVSEFDEAMLMVEDFTS